MDLEKVAEFDTDFRDSFGEPVTKDLLGSDFGTNDEAIYLEKQSSEIPEDSKSSQLIDITSDNNSPESSSDRCADEPVTKSEPLGDGLSIEEVAGERRGPDRENVNASGVLSNDTFEKHNKSPLEDSQECVKDTEIDNNPVLSTGIPEKNTSFERDVSAELDHVNPVAAMEAAASGADSPKSNDCCPFSPGVWFNPEKLHPVVADFVYWRDPKKTGVLFGSSLILLLSLKFFSMISVVAYATLAILSVTVSFRIYKNVLQSVKKSNEGQPFKEYLDMDMSLSSEKLGDTTEVIIHHVNAVINNLRSLILVEDLFDTLKLIVMAWCLTYIGSWFDGMTVLILAYVAAFTLPKLYETNQTQIDAYAELIHVKGKEIMEAINSKIPLGKKKKNE